MFFIGLVMLIATAVMLVVARPRNGEVVHWLRGERRQQIYGFAIVLLLTIGGLLALDGLAR
jgi:hypothetical protein